MSMERLEELHSSLNVFVASCDSLKTRYFALWWHVMCCIIQSFASLRHICWLACQTAAPVEVNADFINLIQVFGFRKSNLVVLLQRPILGLGDSYFMYLTVNFD